MYSFSSRSKTSTFSAMRQLIDPKAVYKAVLSTMSKSIDEVRKACGGRSKGSIC